MGDASENAVRPILNIEGDLVALGPLRRDLLPLYQRWINDLGTMRTLGLAPLPMTSEKEQDWYDRQSKAEDDVPFTIYERETLRPIGNTGLYGLDHRDRSATFGILIGESECRSKGYGTETTRLMLDYAFTALGLHNVMLTVFEFNPAGARFGFCKTLLPVPGELVYWYWSGALRIGESLEKGGGRGPSLFPERSAPRVYSESSRTTQPGYLQRVSEFQRICGRQRRWPMYRVSQCLPGRQSSLSIWHHR
jgi:RimJ/RimL family protein N-acetyltransferase